MNRFKAEIFVMKGKMIILACDTNSAMEWIKQHIFPDASIFTDRAERTSDSTEERITDVLLL